MLHRPDLVLMDVRMPRLDGVEATRRVVAAVPGVRVLAVSLSSDAEAVGRALRAGATGYLLKHATAGEVHDAVDCTLAGRTYLSREVAGVVVERFVRRDGAGGPGAGSGR